jgi:hypothetical protein
MQSSKKTNVVSFADVISDKMSPVVEENQTSIQPGWVKLSRGTHGRTVRDYGPHDLTTKKSILPEQQNVVELLEHNIDLSFEFEKNRYYHPYQQKYESTFNHSSDSEPEEEEDEEEN